MRVHLFGPVRKALVVSQLAWVSRCARSRFCLQPPLSRLSALRVAGEPGDRVQFSEFIVANVRLYALRNDFPLSTPAVANFTRCELAEALRKVRSRMLACEIDLSHYAAPARLMNGGAAQGARAPARLWDTLRSPAGLTSVGP